MLRIALAAALLAATPAHARCMASWYARGRITASGEPFRPGGMTMAMRSRGYGQRYRVTYRGRSVVVRHTDFGPAAHLGRCADLSRAAAVALGLAQAGVGLVTIERETGL